MITKDFFENIEEHLNNELPFVAYRKPNQEQLIGLLQQNTELHYLKDFTEKGFVFSPFDAIEKTIIIPKQASKVIYGHQPYSGTMASGGNENINPLLGASRNNHLSLIAKGIKEIKTTGLKKIVLSRCEHVKLTDKAPISLFRKLSKRYKSALIYCWYHPKVGLWLGATPETLLKVENNRFSIMALAGTQNYKGDLNVVWKPKEKQEQQYVTDFILEKLKPSVSHVKASEVETVRAGNLLHLRTVISAKLNPDASLKHVIEVLHPTPAVCGLPKLQAKQFILENETYDREFYTGFLGELNCENRIAPRSSKRNIENRAYTVKRNSTQLYVNLRCMQLKNNNAIIYVGGGITESSNAESEWEETVSKSLVIKSIL